VTRPLHSYTDPDTWFEDLPVGRRIRHARGATVSEYLNNELSKLVMNTASAHWNEHQPTPFGQGRVVFGLLTASLVIGLASEDTASNALAEVGLDEVRFTSPVHHGDTIYAYSEVLAADPDPERDDAGLVRFKHWGVNQDDVVVFEGERLVQVKRRSHWGER
jgi:itaconyl-CoA hydratase